MIAQKIRGELDGKSIRASRARAGIAGDLLSARAGIGGDRAAAIQAYKERANSGVNVSIRGSLATQLGREG